MIVCPNCNHQNPEGATQCEACYTPLLTTTNCPNCGASVQTDATFCGQCGFNLKLEMDIPEQIPETIVNPPELPEVESPEQAEPETSLTIQIQSEPSSPPEPAISPTMEPEPSSPPEPAISPTMEPEPSSPPEPAISLTMEPEPSSPPEPAISLTMEPEPSSATGLTVATTSQPLPSSEPESTDISPPTVAPAISGVTQLQLQAASLLHVQTDKSIELPQNLSVIHVGKPNDRIPPDIDVSGFPNSDIVSRIHADIRVEGDTFYIEDVGSSNGTYINHTPLPAGNRHRLRAGDRIALGKGDKVTFIFQIS
ncbi:MAG: FHA domain-containing protein [Xenococcaceae cyanobacterium]